jgi:predicted permease
VGRGIEREGELALRMAVGGGRGRIMSQLLVESAALAGLGGAIGALLAPYAAQILVRFIAPWGRQTPLGFSVGIDGRMLAFCIAAAAAAALLSGAAPAILSTRLSLSQALGRSPSRGTARGRIRTFLVCAQFSLSLVLLIGAALFGRSLMNLYAIDTGFRTDAVMTFRVDPVLNGVSRGRTEDIYERLKARLEALPGVLSASLGTPRPLGGSVFYTGAFVEGYMPQPDEVPIVRMNVVSRDYFRTLGVPLFRGRDFDASDRMEAPAVAIVNESFMRRYVLPGPVLGRKVAGLAGPGSYTQAEIVGVVQDAKYEAVRGTAPPQVFVPYRQYNTALGMAGFVHGSLTADQMAAAIRAAVKGIDPYLPVYSLCTLNKLREDLLHSERMIASLATAFSMLAIVLAAIGLYGVLNHDVGRRTRELGVRTALGARRAGLVWSVVKRALLLWAIGAAVAIPVTLGLGRLVASQLVGIEPSDPWTIASATLVLAAVAVVAAASPALRATRIDPAVALRCE